MIKAICLECNFENTFKDQQELKDYNEFLSTVCGGLLKTHVYSEVSE
jgi:hypothetical protein